MTFWVTLAPALLRDPPALCDTPPPNRSSVVPRSFPSGDPPPPWPQPLPFRRLLTPGSLAIPAFSPFRASVPRQRPAALREGQTLLIPAALGWGPSWCGLSPQSMLGGSVALCLRGNLVSEEKRRGRAGQRWPWPQRCRGQLVGVNGDSDASPQIPGAGGWWVWSQGAGVWTVRLELLGGSGVSLCIRLLVV